MNSTKNNTRFYKRLGANKPAVWSLVFILLLIVIAIFAPIIIPDKTPNANTIALELATKQPGFTTQILLKYKGKLLPTSTINAILYGSENEYEQIPINSYSLHGDSISINHFLDDNVQEKITYSISSISKPNTAIADFVKDQIVQKTFYFGTDRFGRDMLSRLLYGARISLAVGFVAVLLSISIGVLLGAMAGYFGGFIDSSIQWLINVIWAIPTLLLVFGITFVLGKGFWQIFIAVGCTMWVGTARLIRGQVMSIKEMDYIQAARTMGFSSSRIIFKHILPNVIGPTIVMAASNFAAAILIEAGLSFLGVGVQPPVPSWGLMIKENYNFIITNKPLLAIIPGLAIMLLVLAFNILGNALRDAFDVK